MNPTKNAPGTIQCQKCQAFFTAEKLRRSSAGAILCRSCGPGMFPPVENCHLCEVEIERDKGVLKSNGTFLCRQCAEKAAQDKIADERARRELESVALAENEVIVAGKWFANLPLGQKWLYSTALISVVAAALMTWRDASRFVQVKVTAWGPGAPAPAEMPLDEVAQIFGIYAVSNFIGWAIILGIFMLLYKSLNKPS